MGIFLISFLVYVHDFSIFEGVKGFSGFSSLRVGIFVVGLMIVALVPWVGWYISSKGKRYAFVMLVPIFMISWQLGVYLFDQRDHSTNDFNFKVLLQFGFVLLLIVFYFIGKLRGK
jgi:hypothetical protein